MADGCTDYLDGLGLQAGVAGLVCKEVGEQGSVLAGRLARLRPAAPPSLSRAGWRLEMVEQGSRADRGALQYTLQVKQYKSPVQKNVSAGVRGRGGPRREVPLQPGRAAGSPPRSQASSTQRHQHTNEQINFVWRFAKILEPGMGAAALAGYIALIIMV